MDKYKISKDFDYESAYSYFRNIYSDYKLKGLSTLAKFKSKFNCDFCKYYNLVQVAMYDQAEEISEINSMIKEIFRCYLIGLSPEKARWMTWCAIIDERTKTFFIDHWKKNNLFMDGMDEKLFHNKSVSILH